MVTAMEAVARTSTPLDSRATQVRWVAALGVIIFAAMGALLAARRYAGALDADLPLSALAPTAALAGAVVFAGRVAWRRSLAEAFPAGGRFAELALAWGGSIGLVLAAIGCSDFSHTRDWLLWLPLVVVDQFHRHWFLHGAWLPGASRKPRAAAIGLNDPDAAAQASTSAPGDDGQVLQQLVRVRDAAGAESIRGMLYAEFAPGQRTATIHVGFCPPLDRLPQVDAEPAGGPDATIKTTQALAHGARLDVRLARPADERCWVAVEFAAGPPHLLAAGPNASP
jgi:hypothetical protein